MTRSLKPVWAATALLPAAAAALGPAALAATPAATPAASGAPELRHWTFHHEHVLGTSLEVSVRAASFAEAQKAEAAVLHQIDADAARLSTWRTGSEVSRWAATRFQPVVVSPELFAVLSLFDQWRERTGGALDASVGAATHLWQTAAAQGRVPSDHEIAMATEAMQQPHWSLDAERHTATRLSDVPLTFASFTKSYITARAADAALAHGASGIMLNVGGDVVVRGDMTQVISVADPHRAAENDGPLDHLVLRNGAIATSGSYRRGVSLEPRPRAGAPQFSHILDPRTAMPSAHVLSSTVVAEDAVTAGALATAFSVLPVEQSQQLAAALPGTQYLLVLADGTQLRGGSAAQASPWHMAAFLPGRPAAGDSSAWNANYELNVTLELPRIDDARYRRPYVAVWIEDADHFPVRTLALWTQNPRWLPDLKQWYRDDQLRNLTEGTDVSRTVSSATRPPGRYTLKWDGKDNEGKLVKAGKYTVVLEASREHGGYDLQRHELSFEGRPEQVTLPAEKELGASTLDYHKR